MPQPRLLASIDLNELPSLRRCFEVVTFCEGSCVQRWCRGRSLAGIHQLPWCVYLCCLGARLACK